jgi:hypothetical protein
VKRNKAIEKLTRLRQGYGVAGKLREEEKLKTGLRLGGKLKFGTGRTRRGKRCDESDK